MSFPQVQVALTGNIGSGKSTVCRMLTALKIPVFYADQAVRDLFEHSEAVRESIRRSYPQAFEEGRISRKILGDIVFENPERLKQLESLLHPLVKEKRRAFINLNSFAPLLVFEIPLLYEEGLENEFDKVLVVACSKNLQKQRVLNRPHMTEEKYAAILKRQSPAEENLARADYVITTEVSKLNAFRQLSAILRSCSRENLL